MDLKDGIKDMIKRQSSHIDSYGGNAESVHLRCYGIDCPNVSARIEIEDVPRGRWPSLLARAAKGWTVDSSGEFICPGCISADKKER